MGHIWNRETLVPRCLGLEKAVFGSCQESSQLFEEEAFEMEQEQWDVCDCFPPSI